MEIVRVAVALVVVVRTRNSERPPSQPHTFSDRLLFDAKSAQRHVFSSVNCCIVALSVFHSTVFMRSLAIYFCSCELRWRSTECVLLPCFNALPDIFAVVYRSVLTLSAVFCSGHLTWSPDNIIYVHYSDTLYNNEKGESV